LAQIFASKLRGMNVLTDRGLQVGRLQDMLVDEESGRIISLVIKPITKEALVDLPKDSSGNPLLPFNSVMAIRDYIVVNERILVIQQLKKPTSKPAEEIPARAPAPAAPAPTPPNEPQLP